MTKRHYLIQVLLVIAYCLLYAGILVTAKLNGWGIYDPLKDAIQVFLAVPIAWLALCTQRRIAYLQALRTLYSQVLHAVQSAIQYTHHPCKAREASPGQLEAIGPTQHDFGQVMYALSKAVDEFRAVFENVAESDDDVGFFPFEELKSIRKELDKLGFGSKFTPAEAKLARDRIVVHWKTMRLYLLKEFDRDQPTWPR